MSHREDDAAPLASAGIAAQVPGAAETPSHPVADDVPVNHESDLFSDEGAATVPHRDDRDGPEQMMAAAPVSIGIARGFEQVVEHRAWCTARDTALDALLLSPCVVVVTGVAGTGKTLLLESLARELMDAGAATLLRRAPDLATTAGPIWPSDSPAFRIMLVDDADRLDGFAAIRARAGGCGMVWAARDISDADIATLSTKPTVVSLAALAPEAVAPFVRERLKQSDLGPDLISEAALAGLPLVSGGIPRTVNMLCGAAMFLAATEQATQVEDRHIRAAAALRGIDFAGAPDPAETSATALAPEYEFANELENESEYAPEKDPIHEPMIAPAVAHLPEPGHVHPPHVYEFEDWETAPELAEDEWEPAPIPVAAAPAFTSKTPLIAALRARSAASPTPPPAALLPPPEPRPMRRKAASAAATIIITAIAAAIAWAMIDTLPNHLPAGLLARLKATVAPETVPAPAPMGLALAPNPPAAIAPSPGPNPGVASKPAGQKADLSGFPPERLRPVPPPADLLNGPEPPQVAATSEPPAIQPPPPVSTRTRPPVARTRADHALPLPVPPDEVASKPEMSPPPGLLAPANIAPPTPIRPRPEREVSRESLDQVLSRYRQQSDAGARERTPPETQSVTRIAPPPRSESVGVYMTTPDGRRVFVATP